MTEAYRDPVMTETPVTVHTMGSGIEPPRLARQVTFAGGYQLGGPMGLQVNLRHKPSWWHRFWMRVCLGLTWVDL